MNSTAPVALESRPCPLGCPPGDELVLVGHDRLRDLPGDFRVVRCASCGLLRTDPRPTPASIGFYYPDDYGPYEGTRVEASGPDARPRWRRGISAVLQRLTRTNAERLPALPPGRMLEIGCASGAFLHRMSARGWEVEGIEFSQSAGGQARLLGFPVHIGPLETAPSPGEPYDLVVGWMVLEHLHDPVGALSRLRGWTRPEGWLVLSVPNAACYELRLFKDAWYSLHLPNHLWHPTPEALRKVLARAGWRLERVFYQRDLRDLVGSLGHVLEDRGLFPRAAAALQNFPEGGGRAHLLLYPFAWLLSLLHQTGRMTVWARPDD